MNDKLMKLFILPIALVAIAWSKTPAHSEENGNLVETMFTGSAFSMSKFLELGFKVVSSHQTDIGTAFVLVSDDGKRHLFCQAVIDFQKEEALSRCGTIGIRR